MQFICWGQTSCLFHLHQISASAARNSGAVLAPRELRQPHCKIVASKEGDKAFVLGSLGDVLQGIHVLMRCQVLSPRRLAASLVFSCLQRIPYAEVRGFAYLYPRMLKRVGLRISIHIC